MKKVNAYSIQLPGLAPALFITGPRPFMGEEGQVGQRLGRHSMACSLAAWRTSGKATITKTEAPTCSRCSEHRTLHPVLGVCGKCLDAEHGTASLPNDAF